MNEAFGTIGVFGEVNVGREHWEGAEDKNRWIYKHGEPLKWATGEPVAEPCLSEIKDALNL